MFANALGKGYLMKLSGLPIGLPVFLLALNTALPAHASQRPCTQVYREMHDRYFTAAKTLRHQLREIQIGGGGSVGVGTAACLMVTKSVIGCTALLGLSGVAVYFSQRALTDQVQQLEDAFKVYEIYQSSHDLNNDRVQKLLVDLNLPPEASASVVRRLNSMMDTGELCADQEPAYSYENILRILTIERLATRH